MSTTRLKMLAVITMLIDHLGEFIPNTPIWFRWIGRISAPLFFFCMAWGFYYTRNRKKYLIRMYFLGVSMEIFNIIANYFRDPHYLVLIENNIFVTLFVSTAIIFLIDALNSNLKKGIKYLSIFILIQLIGTFLILYIIVHVDTWVTSELLGAIFGNIFVNEGGIPFILLGILIYYTKNNKKKLALVYVVFSICYSFFYYTNTFARILIRLETILPDTYYYVISVMIQLLGIDIRPVYHTRFYAITSYHWMIIFALPFILIYNGESGKGYKYFFYIFYPLHIYLLFFIGNIITVYQ